MFVRSTLCGVLITLLVLPAQAEAEFPRGRGVDPREDARLGPIQVCEQMVKAISERHYDDLLVHTSVYARVRAGFLERLAIRLARRRLAGAMCLEARPSDPSHALVQVRSASGEASIMPFLREEGVWRFDQKRWEDLRDAGRSARP